ncbi:MAG: hypothetical protein K6G92_08720 [Bacteroidaceae bacterium]|nr:hypothetical protein [Bacteroidaceae bacterium]
MKTIKRLACLCAVALAGVSYLSSCTSEEVNPNYDAERGVVKTEFTISIPAKPAGTRMTAATVQGQTTPVFRGIEGIKLYPFKEKVATITNAPASVALPSIINLAGGTVSTQGPSGTAANTIANSGALFPNNNSHLYQDIEVAIGTQAFMIYGVAMPSKVNPTTPPTDPTEFATYANNLATNGTLRENLESSYTLGGTTYDKATNLGAITFSPVPIHSSETIDNAGNGVSIASYLTSIANAKANSNATEWGASDNVILQTLYQKFITMKAGSWASVKGAVQQLYTSIYNRTDAVSGAIKTAILADSYVKDEEGGSADGILEFTTGAYGDYPADIHLPDGAAYVIWNSSSSRFDAVPGTYDSGTVLTSGTSLAGYYTKNGDVYTACSSTGTADGSTTYYKRTNKDNNGLDIPNLSKFVYPAPLYYRALSDIRTSNVSMSKYYDTVDQSNTEDMQTWPGVISKYGTSDVVLASTRSIAIVDQVQYAVGRLDAIVYTQNNVTTLKDNENKDISIMTGSTYNFPITGILIGGQKAVDYKFEQITTGDAYTIYDNDITGIYMTENANNTATHTLVFETKAAAAANDPDCVTKISVEFQNNSGKLFVGKDGEIIYPGSKFYLVGAFDPYLNTTAANPHTYTGTNTPINKTFVQDYVTTANLVIASLKNAYNTMPDLRAPQLELGLSVDLTWNPGITQTVIIQ